MARCRDRRGLWGSGLPHRPPLRHSHFERFGLGKSGPFQTVPVQFALVTSTAGTSMSGVYNGGVGVPRTMSGAGRQLGVQSLHFRTVMHTFGGHTCYPQNRVGRRKSHTDAHVWEEPRPTPLPNTTGHIQGGTHYALMLSAVELIALSTVSNSPAASS